MFGGWRQAKPSPSDCGSLKRQALIVRSGACNMRLPMQDAVEKLAIRRFHHLAIAGIYWMDAWIS